MPSSGTWICALGVSLLLAGCVSDPLNPNPAPEIPSAEMHSVVPSSTTFDVQFDTTGDGDGISPQNADALFSFIRATTPWGKSSVIIEGPHANAALIGPHSTLDARRTANLRRALELGGVSPVRIEVHSTSTRTGWRIHVE